MGHNVRNPKKKVSFSSLAHKLTILKGYVIELQTMRVSGSDLLYAQPWFTKTPQAQFSRFFCLFDADMRSHLEATH